MDKVKISLFQLYTLMFLFTIGTASIIGAGATAKQDAWIAIIISFVAGCVVFIINMYIFKNYPDITLTMVFEKLLGKVIGKLFMILYVLYFLSMSTLVLRDIGELLAMYALVGTPLLVTQGLCMLVVSYAIYLGLETVARTSEMNIFASFGIYILLIIFIVLSGIVEINNLLPILEEGIKPVIEASTVMTLAFPFGELIVFFMIFKDINKKKKIMKVGLLALSTTGLIILILTLLNLTALGTYMFTTTPFPLVETIRLISIGSIIERVDSLSVIVFMIGVFYKLIIYNIAIHIGIKEIFKTQKPSKAILPISIIILLLGTFYFDSYTKFIDFAIKAYPYYVNFPFEIGIPFLLVIIIFIKNRFKNRKNKRKRR